MVPAKLMTNIAPNYYAFIEKEAKQQNRSKRDIIEEAIKLYMKKKWRDEVFESYKGMENDEEYKKEMVELAEEGMEYFLKDISLND